jgi:hypothetical protein
MLKAGGRCGRGQYRTSFRGLEMTVVPQKFTAPIQHVSKYLSSSNGEELLKDTTCNAVILGTLLTVNVLPEVHKVIDVTAAALI